MRLLTTQCQCLDGPQAGKVWCEADANCLPVWPALAGAACHSSLPPKSDVCTTTDAGTLCTAHLTLSATECRDSVRSLLVPILTSLAKTLEEHHRAILLLTIIQRHGLRQSPSRANILHRDEYFQQCMAASAGGACPRPCYHSRNVLPLRPTLSHVRVGTAGTTAGLIISSLNAMHHASTTCRPFARRSRQKSEKHQ